MWELKFLNKNLGSYYFYKTSNNNYRYYKIFENLIHLNFFDKVLRIYIQLQKTITNILSIHALWAFN